MVVHESTGRFGTVDKSVVRTESGSDMAQRCTYQYSTVERTVSRAYERSLMGRHALLREADQAEAHSGAQSGRAAAGANQASVGRDPIGSGYFAGRRGQSRGPSLYSAIEPRVSKYLIQIVEVGENRRNLYCRFHDLVNMPLIIQYYVSPQGSTLR